MKNSGTPIYPFIPKQPWDDESSIGYMGLTKREYFAGLAMQGLLGNSDWATGIMTPNDWDEYKERVTKSSIEISDELLKQLETK